MPRHGSTGDAGGKNPVNGTGEDNNSLESSGGIPQSISSPVFSPTRSRASSESKLSQGSQDKTGNSSSKLLKKESLKVQKKYYRNQKKQATKELLSTLKDASVIVLADWLKVRGTLKGWTKLWCVIKPGLLVLYKSEKQKSSHWVGTVLLNTCRLIERPSKKDGFCFKLFHPLDQSIWATKGPKGETIGAIVQPLPYSYLICRALSEAAGKCWMDALELSLKCTNLLMRSMKKDIDLDTSQDSHPDVDLNFDSNQQLSENLNESDCEKHFEDQESVFGLDEDMKTDREDVKTDSETESEEEEDKTINNQQQPLETPYVENVTEELGQQGDAGQTEEVDDENKSLIWTLVKQVRPGMDLSKVVLPTFILEPRSFLDKLTDYHYHADILSGAVTTEDPFTRIKMVTKWYLSGFYKKPKGLKKPYNPIIGETFRCYWHHPKTNSRTFYIAEQISHHPPVSAFHITNRQDGFSVSGSILAKSKFYGNSLSAVLDGTAKLTFLKRGEDYFITMPYAHCKGILIGTLTMEMGGKVTIGCPKTGYKCEMEFKLKPFLGSGEASNRIVGKFKCGSDTIATLEGRWDQEIHYKDKSSGDVSLFWQPTQEVKSQRLKRFTVPLELQGEMESERLWKNVSEAVITCDMKSATDEKFILEERQRTEAKERKARLLEWVPALFERDVLTNDWVYKFIDMRPWDVSNDLLQYEVDYRIQTWTKHRTPVVRTCSITSLEKQPDSLNSSIRNTSIRRLKVVGEESESSECPEAELLQDSDSSERLPGKNRRVQRSCSSNRNRLTEETIVRQLQPLVEIQKELSDNIKRLNSKISNLSLNQPENDGMFNVGSHWIILAVVLTFQVFLQWLFR